MKKKLLGLLLAVVMITSMFVIMPVSAQTDYKEIYMNFARQEDVYANDEYMHDKSALAFTSGMIMLDLNADSIPELLAYSITNTHFDKDGNFVTDSDEAVEVVKEYIIEKGFYIKDGEVVEHTPWKVDDGNGVTTYKMYPIINILPGEESPDDTEALCSFARYKRGSADDPYLMMYYVPDERIPGRQKIDSMVNVIYFDLRDGFGFASGEYDEYVMSFHQFDSDPVASQTCYVSEQGNSNAEAMETLINKYESRKSAFSSNEESRSSTVSDWAVAEVNEAKKLNLIPPEMLNDNLTEDITRAEFAAIAVQLHQAIVGEELNWHGGYIIDIDGNMYEMYIRGAYKFGITNGTGKKDGGVLFSPDLNITREQLATMLCRVVKLNKFEDWISGDDSDFSLDISNAKKFSDDSEISDYANEAVYYMSKHGVIKGVDNDHFAPLDTATKEQAIILALRIYGAFDELPTSQTKLRLNYEVIEQYVNTSDDQFVSIGVEQLISGFEDKKYTIEDLSDILNVDFHRTAEILDSLGLFSCQAFDWNGYNITIISYNEEAEDYSELDKYPTYIECSDGVIIRTTDIKNFKLNFTELSLEVGEVFPILHTRIDAFRVSEFDVIWSSSNEDVATVEDMGESGCVYAKNPGTTYITAQVQQGDNLFQAQCRVVVENEPEE